MSKNLSELSGRKGIDDNLFERIGNSAQSTGSPSHEELSKIADEFLVGNANTFGTSSFYDFTKSENKGKKIYVCNGSACLCAGTQKNVFEILENHFKSEEIGHMTCLGRCYENSAFHYNGKNYSGRDIDNFSVNTPPKSFSKYVGNIDSNSFLTTPFEGFSEFSTLIKNTLSRSPEDLLDEIKKSQIRGRGGAGFPMGLKWESCKNETCSQKFIICNADEGDPGAFSDRFLLEERPYSVLFGMIVAGYITGANRGILYIRAEYPEAVKIVQQAIDSIVKSTILTNTNGFNFVFKIIKAKGAYICGEETALINSIEGQRPEVRTRPPFPTQMGLFNKPTVVNNVETLASVHGIIKKGAEFFSKIGTPKSKGTKLVCLDSFFNNPGLYEVEMGSQLSDLVFKLGGGFKTPIKAMQIGGPLGGIVPVSMINELTIDFESFASHGFLLGHASIVCIPENFPMINYLEHLMEIAAYESCGKCFPCRLGTKRGHELLHSAIHEKNKIEYSLFQDLLNTLQQASLCAHGGGIPLPIKNAMHYFENELHEYFKK